MIDQDVLARLKLNKGDMALDPVQLASRIEFFTNATWPWAARERNPTEYRAWIDAMADTLAEAEANTVFNRQLEAYRKAQARLNRYRLADGQPEITEDQPTGETDEEGNPITQSVVIQSAIEALPAEIEQPVLDPETGEQTSVEMVPNPAIITDDAERVAAQAAVDATPQEVVIYWDLNQP